MLSMLVALLVTLCFDIKISMAGDDESFAFDQCHHYYSHPGSLANVNAIVQLPDALYAFTVLLGCSFENGIDVVDGHGWTSMMWAAELMNGKLMGMLLIAGASQDSQSARTLLGCAPSTIHSIIGSCSHNSSQLGLIVCPNWLGFHQQPRSQISWQVSRNV